MTFYRHPVVRFIYLVTGPVLVVTSWLFFRENILFSIMLVLGGGWLLLIGFCHQPLLMVDELGIQIGWFPWFLPPAMALSWNDILKYDLNENIAGQDEPILIIYRRFDVKQITCKLDQMDEHWKLVFSTFESYANEKGVYPYTKEKPPA